MSTEKYRLLTRSDFDGLVCAILLTELDMLDEITFVHPKDVQDGKIDVSGRDILTNLPFVDGCHLCFDHHESESIRNYRKVTSHCILNSKAASAARVVYEHFGGRRRFSEINAEMIAAVDTADSARFTRDDVLDPTGWALLSFLMDARTGLGRFGDFHVSNYRLMMDLIAYCRDHGIDEILALPDVRERVDVFFAHQAQAIEQIGRCASMHGGLVVLDLRNEETIYACNRFLIYALFPECNISMHVLWGLRKQNTVLTVGKSIFDRSCKTNIGALCLRYQGGGHTAAGTCQIPNDEAERVKTELIELITYDADLAAHALLV